MLQKPGWKKILANHNIILNQVFDDDVVYTHMKKILKCTCTSDFLVEIRPACSVSWEGILGMIAYNLINSIVPAAWFESKVHKNI